MAAGTELRVEALIFDLDGTLVDTLDDIADSLNRVLAARGLPVHARDAVRRMVGGGAAKLVREALPEHARATAAALFEDYRRDYLANLIVRSAPYPGVTDLLDSLASAGVPMCVLSNKPHAPTQQLISALFPATPFIEVVGERQGKPRKPDPHALIERAGQLLDYV